MHYSAGKLQTEPANPAGLFAFGNTFETRRQTIGGLMWVPDGLDPKFNNADPQNYGNGSLLYFGTRMVFVFADGHTGTLPYQGGCRSGNCCDWVNRVGSPSTFTARVNGYCANPDGTVNSYPDPEPGRRRVGKSGDLRAIDQSMSLSSDQ